MAGYVSPPPPHPLGQHRPKIEKLQNQQGLTPAGFKKDGSDIAAADKAELERRVYERANAKASVLGISGGAANAATDPESDPGEEAG